MAGKWIVQLQTSLVFVQDRPAQTKSKRDSLGRTPFQHPALEGLEGLTHDARYQIINKKDLAQLGNNYGLQNVVRWAPKNVSELRPFLLFEILTTTGICSRVTYPRRGSSLSLHTPCTLLSELSLWSRVDWLQIR